MRIVDAKGDPIGGQPSANETFRELCQTVLDASAKRHLSRLADIRASEVRDVARECSKDAEAIPAGTLTIRRPANFPR